MKIELVPFNIVGVKPLLQDNPVTMTRKESKGVSTKQSPVIKSENDEAAQRLYINDDGLFYHPMLAFFPPLMGASSYKKFGKFSVSTVLGIAVEIAEEEFILCQPETLNTKKPKSLGEADWVPDTRRAVNKTAGAIIVSRPKWRKWGGILTLEIDRDYVVNLKDMVTLLNGAGRLGIGCGRRHKAEGKSWKGCGLGKFTAELRNGQLT